MCLAAPCTRNSKALNFSVRRAWRESKMVMLRLSAVFVPSHVAGKKRGWGSFEVLVLFFRHECCRYCRCLAAAIAAVALEICNKFRSPITSFCCAPAAASWDLNATAFPHAALDSYLSLFPFHLEYTMLRLQLFANMLGSCSGRTLSIDRRRASAQGCPHMSWYC